MTCVKASSICCIALSALLLASCDVTTPSQVRTGEIQVKDVMKTVTLDTTKMNPGEVEYIATDYLHNGSGPMRLVIPYTPGNPLNKVAAEAQGDAYGKAFTAQHVRDFRVSYTATVEPGAMSVLSYMALAAEPPSHCHHIAGWYGAETLNETADENFGCEIKSAESQMVARPADLLGTPGVPEDDAKRQGTLVEKYRSGTPNPELKGLNASKTGSGGG